MYLLIQGPTLIIEKLCRWLYGSPVVITQSILCLEPTIRVQSYTVSVVQHVNIFKLFSTWNWIKIAMPQWGSDQDLETMEVNLG